MIAEGTEKNVLVNPAAYMVAYQTINRRWLQSLKRNLRIVIGFINRCRDDDITEAVSAFKFLTLLKSLVRG